MINIDEEKLSVSGTGAELLTELTVIMLDFVSEGVADIDDLVRAVAIAKAYKEKDNARKDKFREKFVDKLFE